MKTPDACPHFSEALWLGCLLGFAPWGLSSEARIAFSQDRCSLSPAFLQRPWPVASLMLSCSKAQVTLRHPFWFFYKRIDGFFFPTFLRLISLIPSFWKELSSSAGSWVRTCSWGTAVSQTDRVLLGEAHTLREAFLERTAFKFKRPRLNQNVKTCRCVKWLFLLWPIQCLKN